MKLKYKNTEFTYGVKKTNDRVGLNDDDFWLEFDTSIKNDEVNLYYERSAFSFNEFVDLNNWANDCINGKKVSKTYKFIKHFDEFKYNKDKTLTHRFYVFDDTKEYYDLVYEKDEILKMIELDKNIIDEISNK